MSSRSLRPSLQMWFCCSSNASKNCCSIALFFHGAPFWHGAEAVGVEPTKPCREFGGYQRPLSIADCSSPPVKDMFSSGSNKRKQSAIRKGKSAHCVAETTRAYRKDNLSTSGKHGSGAKLPEKLKVDRKKFEGIVKNLLQSQHVKHDDVKPSKKKPEKLIPPQK
jgi:hypothetical protein